MLPLTAIVGPPIPSCICKLWQSSPEIVLVHWDWLLLLTVPLLHRWLICKQKMRYTWYRRVLLTTFDYLLNIFILFCCLTLLINYGLQVSKCSSYSKCLCATFLLLCYYAGKQNITFSSNSAKMLSNSKLPNCLNISSSPSISSETSPLRSAWESSVKSEKSPGWFSGGTAVVCTLWAAVCESRRQTWTREKSTWEEEQELNLI